MRQSYRNTTFSALHGAGDQKIKKELEVNNNFYTGELIVGEDQVTFIFTRSTSSQQQQLIDNKPEGLGVAYFANGASYKGEFEKGKPHGKGTMKYANGASYKGELEKGKPHGKGGCVFADGTLYEGEWIDGKLHGKGTMKYANGASYKGELEKGKPHGKGGCVFADGTLYEGEFENGKRHGKGKTIYPNGDYYERKWKNGEPEGDVICTYENGTVYKGGWGNDEPHGWGTMIYPDGDYYQGKFENGTAVDFSKIRIIDSNGAIHTTIIKKNGLYYSQGVGDKEQEIDIDIENKEILKSFLLQFGNIQSNQEGTKKMKDPEELRKFIEESEYVRLPHEFNVICEKLKELRNESKGDESLSDQKPGLLINTSSCEQVTNWLSRIMSGWCC